MIVSALAYDTFPKIKIDKDEEYEKFDKYVDKQIANGSIVKHDEFVFTGVGWAEKVKIP